MNRIISSNEYYKISMLISITECLNTLYSDSIYANIYIYIYILIFSSRLQSSFRSFCHLFISFFLSCKKFACKYLKIDKNVKKLK